MEKVNPDIKHIIPADIQEKYISEHLSSAAIVAAHKGKSIQITRKREGLPSIEILIMPDSSPDVVIKKYEQEVEKMTPDGTGNNISISSPKHDINRQDI